jgi:hypothetical protein
MIPINYNLKYTFKIFTFSSMILGNIMSGYIKSCQSCQSTAYKDGKYDLISPCIQSYSVYERFLVSYQWYKLVLQVPLQMILNQKANPTLDPAWKAKEKGWEIDWLGFKIDWVLRLIGF